MTVYRHGGDPRHRVTRSPAITVYNQPPEAAADPRRYIDLFSPTRLKCSFTREAA